MVHELELEPGNDTLSCWMAHYIGEQISTAEIVEGDEKIIAEQRCYETILKLWKHRALLPSGQRPFESFEPIFRALEGLDPERQDSFYFPRPNFIGDEDASESQECDDVQQWVDVALGVDQSARILIDFAFKQAAQCAKDENTKCWIENEIDLKSADDLSVLVRLLPALQDDSKENELEQIRKEQEKTLRSRIEKLEVFTELSSILHRELLDELDKISLDDDV